MRAFLPILKLSLKPSP